MLSARGTTHGSARVGWILAADDRISAAVAPQAYARPIVSAPLDGTVRSSCTHTDVGLLKAMACGASCTIAAPRSCRGSPSEAEAYFA